MSHTPVQAPCPAVAGQHKQEYSGILPDLLSHIVWVCFCVIGFLLAYFGFCLNFCGDSCVCVFLGYFVCFRIIVLKREMRSVDWVGRVVGENWEE